MVRNFRCLGDDWAPAQWGEYGLCYESLILRWLLKEMRNVKCSVVKKSIFFSLLNFDDRDRSIYNQCRFHIDRPSSRPYYDESIYNLVTNCSEPLYGSLQKNKSSEINQRDWFFALEDGIEPKIGTDNAEIFSAYLHQLAKQ